MFGDADPGCVLQGAGKELGACKEVPKLQNSTRLKVHLEKFKFSGPANERVGGQKGEEGGGGGGEHTPLPHLPPSPPPPKLPTN